MTNPYTPLGIRKIILRVEKRNDKTSKEIDAIRDAIINGNETLAKKYGITLDRIPKPYNPDVSFPPPSAPPLPPVQARIVALQNDMRKAFAEWDARLDQILKEAK